MLVFDDCFYLLGFLIKQNSGKRQLEGTKSSDFELLTGEVFKIGGVTPVKCSKLRYLLPNVIKLRNSVTKSEE